MLTLIAKKGLTHAQIPEKFLKCPSMKKKSIVTIEHQNVPKILVKKKE